MSNDPYVQVLQKYWKHEDFRHSQREVIEAIMEGKDAMVIWSTGSGKSLCYQIPPLIKKCPAIVISPLISLMQDQVLRLKQRGIRAEFLGSAQSDIQAKADIWTGKVSIIYMTPEFVEYSMDRIVELKNRYGLTCIAVDEAHCVVEWGFDFRQAFLELWKLRQCLPDVPIVAATGTARPEVETTIKTKLQMDLENTLVTRNSTFRKNLFYQVKYIFSRVKKDLDMHLRDLIEEKKQTGKLGATIIYVQTKTDAQTIYDQLKQIFDNGGSIALYHADVKLSERNYCLQAFQNDEIEVVIATVAFGMGIDKPNIRNVYMWGHPASIEGFYQMAGRAGRDGKPAKVVVVADLSDPRQIMQIKTSYENDVHNDKQIHLEHVTNMAKFCFNQSACRHAKVAQYLGDFSMRTDCKNMCDVCVRKYDKNHIIQTPQYLSQESKDEDMLKLLKVVSAKNMGQRKIIDVLRGKKTKNVQDCRDLRLGTELVFGTGRHENDQYWEILFVEAIYNQYVAFDVVFYSERALQTFTVQEKGVKFMKAMTTENQDLGKILTLLFQTWSDLAGESVVDRIGKNVVQQISKNKPRNMSQLHDIEGLDAAVINRMGPVIIEFVQMHKCSQQIDDVILESKVLERMSYLKPHHTDKLFSQPKDLAWNLYSLFQDGKSVNDLQDSGKCVLNHNTTVGYLAETLNLFGPKTELDLQRLQKETYLKDDMIRCVEEALSQKQDSSVGKIMFFVEQHLQVEMSIGQIKLALALLKCGKNEFSTNDEQQQQQTTHHDNTTLVQNSNGYITDDLLDSDFDSQNLIQREPQNEVEIQSNSNEMLSNSNVTRQTENIPQNAVENQLNSNGINEIENILQNGVANQFKSNGINEIENIDSNGVGIQSNGSIQSVENIPKNGIQAQQNSNGCKEMEIFAPQTDVQTKLNNTSANDMEKMGAQTGAKIQSNGNVNNVVQNSNGFGDDEEGGGGFVVPQKIVPTRKRKRLTHFKIARNKQ